MTGAFVLPVNRDDGFGVGKGAVGGLSIQLLSHHSSFTSLKMLWCQVLVNPESFQRNGRLKQKTGVLNPLKKGADVSKIRKNQPYRHTSIKKNIIICWKSGIK
jgi:hypothetical protein